MKLKLFLIIMIKFSLVVAIPVGILVPRHRVSIAEVTELRPWPLSYQVRINTQKLFDLASDNPIKLDSGSIALVCMDEVVLQLQKERNCMLQDLFVRYVEFVHLFGDDGLAAAICKNLDLVGSEDLQRDDILWGDTTVVAISGGKIDGSMVISKVVDGILSRYSFTKLEDVCTALKELEQMIQSDLKSHGIETHAELVQCLHELNEKPLSVSSHCIAQVSRVLNQLPSKSSQAIRDRFPWYLRRWV